MSSLHTCMRSVLRLFLLSFLHFPFSLRPLHLLRPLLFLSPFAMESVVERVLQLYEENEKRAYSDGPKKDDEEGEEEEERSADRNAQ